MSAGVASTSGLSVADQTTTIDPILFDSTGSLLDDSGNPLTDDSLVAVWAEPTAYNDDADGNSDATVYPDGTDIPVVAVDGAVVGIGTPFVPNDTDFGYGSEEFLLNLYDYQLGGSGTVLWDASHSQFYQLESDGNGGNGPGFGKFGTYAEDNGYTLQSTTDLRADLDSADAVVITSPAEAFSDAETAALSTFVDTGGAVFLHDQSDYSDYDQTAYLNDLAASVGVDFRFNDDQVYDETNNAGSNFLPTTAKFNIASFESLFANRPGIDEATALDPSQTYTVDVVDVADGDTIDVQFDDDRVETVRVLGIDTPEKRTASDAERPEEWEGLADRVGLLRVAFDSTSSLLDANMDPLSSDVTAVYAEPEAYTVDADDNGDAVPYPSDTDIPLVAIDGHVAGFGGMIANDETLSNTAALDNEEFLLNVWDELLGGSGTVRWDESHGQFYDRSTFSTFADYAGDNGYSVEAGSAIPADTSGVDALVVTSPESFSSSELAALSSFVGDGGVVLLHDQADYNDFDQTTNLNTIAAELGVSFRFNNDQVQDDTNNTGQPFVPTTTRFDPTFDLFRERKGVDQELVVASEGTPVEQLAFGESVASLLNASEQPLTDSTLVPIFAEPSATNENGDGNGDAVSYPSDADIPLVAVDGQVAGFGGPLVNDGEDKAADNEEFMLNLYDELLGGSGTIRWDESHDQFYGLSKFSTFADYAGDNGYTIEAGSAIPADASVVDGLVITSPGSFSSSELAALSSFVGDGGVVFLHDQDDYNDYDQTANLNAIAAELGVDFRFNDDQVIDEQHNLGQPFRPTTTNCNTADFSLFTERPGVDDVEDFWGATYPYLSYHGATATTYAREQLAGETVDISFDEVGAQFNDGVKDPFGRVLAYIHYDASGDGTRDALYNERVIENGHARSYASSLTKLETLLDAEHTARASGSGVWRQANPRASPRIRDGPVSEVFVPKAVRVGSVSGAVGDGRIVMTAGSSASPASAPLAAVDESNNIGLIGGLVIDERYEQAEGFATDTSGDDNFTLTANMLDYLGDSDGPVLVVGGSGQFNASHALAGEDVAYFQRFLEGYDIELDAINDLTVDRLDQARGVIVTPPTEPLSETELSALAEFAANGGAVVLLGGSNAPAEARSNLNEIAAGLGSDLELTDEAVTDETSNRNGDKSIPTTTALNDTLPLSQPFTVIDRYDRNDDEQIQHDELNKAIRDYLQDDLSPEGLNGLIRSYLRSY